MARFTGSLWQLEWHLSQVPTWYESGLFELLLHLVNDDATYSTLLEIDSTLKDQAIGASRGGKNIKVHVLINDRIPFPSPIIMTAFRSFTPSWNCVTP